MNLFIAMSNTIHVSARDREMFRSLLNGARCVWVFGETEY